MLILAVLPRELKLVYAVGIAVVCALVVLIVHNVVGLQS